MSAWEGGGELTGSLRHLGTALTGYRRIEKTRDDETVLPITYVEMTYHCRNISTGLLLLKREDGSIVVALG